MEYRRWGAAEKSNGRQHRRRKKPMKEQEEKSNTEGKSCVTDRQSKPKVKCAMDERKVRVEEMEEIVATRLKPPKPWEKGEARKEVSEILEPTTQAR